MKSTHTRSSRATLLFAFISLLVLQSPVFAQDKAAKIDEVVRLYHSYGQFNGTVLVADDGKVIYRKGFGQANMEWNIPNEPETKFRLGSITKQFTALLILQMVEAGKLKLDGKITDYLPDYRKDIGDRVTIHHLLTHTSGIPSYTGLPGFMKDDSRNPYTVADFVKKYASRDLEFEPGSKFAYNNSGYFLLGAIIEKVNGKPYEQVLKANILDPLGMKNAGYDHHNRLIQKRAAGYVKTLNGYENAPYLDMSLPYAAGSMYATVDDLFLWDQALYSDKLLSGKYKELMFKPNLDNYAYGWVIRKASLGDAKDQIPTVSHGGGINGFSTLITRMVDKKQTIVLLDNTSQGRRLGPLSQAILNILYDQPYSPPKKSIAETLLPTATEKGVEAAIKQYRELKASQAAAYDFGAMELNTLGYQLLGMKRTKDAIEVFKLNVEAYPQASNPYDSLGEAYMMNGDKELAIKNYQKALELNPKNAGAANALKKLEGQASKVDSKTFDAYVGQYEVQQLGLLNITKEGEKLMGQPTGQSKEELIPQSEDQFYVERIRAQVSFVKDDKGLVTQIVLRGDGRELQGKKIK